MYISFFLYLNNLKSTFFIVASIIAGQLVSGEIKGRFKQFGS